MGGAGGIGVCRQCGVREGKWGGKPCDGCEGKAVGEGANISQVKESQEDEITNMTYMNKALNPSSIHAGDAELPEDQRRHYANYQRALQMFGRPKPTPEPIFTDEWVRHNPWMGDANREHMGLPPHETQPLRNVNPGAYPFNPKGRGGPRTLPPNPPLMPPMAGAPNIQERPSNPAEHPRPLSEDNPYGRIKESELQRLADEYGIPFSKSWTFLKEECQECSQLQAQNAALQDQVKYLHSMIDIVSQQRDAGQIGGD